MESNLPMMSLITIKTMKSRIAVMIKPPVMSELRILSVMIPISDFSMLATTVQTLFSILQLFVLIKKLSLFSEFKMSIPARRARVSS